MGIEGREGKGREEEGLGNGRKREGEKGEGRGGKRRRRWREVSEEREGVKTIPPPFLHLSPMQQPTIPCLEACVKVAFT